jgi:hypothetical protein
MKRGRIGDEGDDCAKVVRTDGLGLLNLPPELLDMISRFLAIPDQLAFRHTCRYTHQIIFPPFLNTLMLSKAYGNGIAKLMASGGADYEINKIRKTSESIKTITERFVRLDIVAPTDPMALRAENFKGAVAQVPGLAALLGASRNIILAGGFLVKYMCTPDGGANDDAWSGDIDVFFNIDAVFDIGEWLKSAKQYGWRLKETIYYGQKNINERILNLVNDDLPGLPLQLIPIRWSLEQRILNFDLTAVQFYFANGVVRGTAAAFYSAYTRRIPIEWSGRTSGLRHAEGQMMLLCIEAIKHGEPIPNTVFTPARRLRKYQDRGFTFELLPPEATPLIFSHSCYSVNPYTDFTSSKDVISFLVKSFCCDIGGPPSNDRDLYSRITAGISPDAQGSDAFMHNLEVLLDS